MIKKLIMISLCLIALVPLVHSARTPTITTIPPVSAMSSGVSLDCTPLQTYPGSVTIGSSGFIEVRCPTSGAVTLGTNAPIVLTPSLTLGIGYINASIAFPSGSCSNSFGSLTTGNITVTTGHYLNSPITFANPPISSSQMLSTDYKYCLQYQNAPSTGLTGFNIVWT